MDSRWHFLLPVALLVTWCASLLQIASAGDHLSAVAFLAATMACGLVGWLLARQVHVANAAPATAPAFRRLRGSFQQQSRPGVPGRVRARAPGCGH